MLAVLSQIGLHFRHNSPLLWFWDLYSHITVYGWVVITHQDFEATDDNLAHSPPPATLPSEGSCRSCYIRRKNRIWKPQHKGLRNFILRIPSGLGLMCWAENAQYDFFQKKAMSGGESERQVTGRLCGRMEFSLPWISRLTISDDFLYFKYEIRGLSEVSFPCLCNACLIHSYNHSSYRYGGMGFTFCPCDWDHEPFTNWP